MMVPDVAVGLSSSSFSVLQSPPPLWRPLPSPLTSALIDQKPSRLRPNHDIFHRLHPSVAASTGLVVPSNDITAVRPASSLTAGRGFEGRSV